MGGYGMGEGGEFGIRVYTNIAAESEKRGRGGVAPPAAARLSRPIIFARPGARSPLLSGPGRPLARSGKEHGPSRRTGSGQTRLGELDIIGIVRLFVQEKMAVF